MDEGKEEVAEVEVSENEVEESIEEAKDEMDEAEEMDEEMDLDEILAELEGELSEGDSEDITEGEDEMSEAKEEVEEAEEAEETETEEEDEEGEAGEEDEEIDLEDMSEEDLKKFIEDVIEDMVKAGELEAGEGFEDDVEVDVDAEGEIEVEDDEMTAVDMAEGEDMDEGKEEMDEAKDEMDEAKKELDEALETIATLKTELNEINLLNAKLLYANKIFKSKNMTESQKAKVLGAFDKAGTVSEVKVVFETLNENFKPAKKTVNEGVIGSASKATGLVKEAKQPIVESDEMVNRFKKLAGII
jgi:chromosome segregation ATPase